VSILDLSFHHHGSSGFTLVELLVVIAVLGVVIAYSIPSFLAYIQSQYLKQGAEQVLSDLRSAQSRAQNGILSGSYECWGLEFNGLNIYEAKSYDCDDYDSNTLVKTLSLPATVTASGSDIVFKKLSGMPDIASLTTVILTYNGVTKSVKIETGGNMYVE